MKCFETQNMEEEVLQFCIDFKFEIYEKFQVEDNIFLVGKKIYYNRKENTPETNKDRASPKTCYCTGI